MLKLLCFLLFSLVAFCLPQFYTPGLQHSPANVFKFSLKRPVHNKTRIIRRKLICIDGGDIKSTNDLNSSPAGNGLDSVNINSQRDNTDGANSDNTDGANSDNPVNTSIDNPANTSIDNPVKTSIDNPANTSIDNPNIYKIPDLSISASSNTTISKIPPDNTLNTSIAGPGSSISNNTLSYSSTIPNSFNKTSESINNNGPPYQENTGSIPVSPVLLRNSVITNRFAFPNNQFGHSKITYNISRMPAAAIFPPNIYNGPGLNNIINPYINKPPCLFLECQQPGGIRQPPLNSHPNFKTKPKIKKCFVVDATFLDESQIQKLIENISKNTVNINFVYKKHIRGLSFCSDPNTAIEVLKIITEKYPLVNIEDDALFRVAYPSSSDDSKKPGYFNSEYLYSIFLYTHYLYSIDSQCTDFLFGGMPLSDACPRMPDQPKPQSAVNKGDKQKHNNITGKRSDKGKHGSQNKTSGKHKRKPQHKMTNLPIHLFRIKNTGNLIFNNYILDNPVFRILGISRLIARAYKYNHTYNGSRVNITVIDAPKCHHGRRINELLLQNQGITLSGGSSVKFIDIFGCNGTAPMSKLISALDGIEPSGILLLPFYGPHSEILDLVVKKLSKIMTVVVAGGDEEGDACNFSPGGPQVIRVGSSTKHGYVSKFSNRGRCITLYSLGEDIFGRDGTGHSAAIVASIVAMYKEKNSVAMGHEILNFLLQSSARNEYKEQIMKLPVLTEQEDGKKPTHYSWFIVISFYFIVVLSIVLLVIGALYYFIWRVNLNRPRSLRPHSSPLLT